MNQSAINTPNCPYCGSVPHAGICPSVKALEYYPDGTIKRVEFKSPADYLAPVAPRPLGEQPITPTFRPATSYAQVAQQGGRRDDWHYDGQGYCDNPGRGY